MRILHENIPALFKRESSEIRLLIEKEVSYYLCQSKLAEALESDEVCAMP